MKQIKIIILILLFTNTITFGQKQYQSMIKEADKTLSENKYCEAIDLYYNALQVTPSKTEEINNKVKKVVNKAKSTKKQSIVNKVTSYILIRKYNESLNTNPETALKLLKKAFIIADTNKYTFLIKALYKAQKFINVELNNKIKKTDLYICDAIFTKNSKNVLVAGDKVSLWSLDGKLIRIYKDSLEQGYILKLSSDGKYFMFSELNDGYHETYVYSLNGDFLFKKGGRGMGFSKENKIVIFEGRSVGIYDIKGNELATIKSNGNFFWSAYLNKENIVIKNTRFQRSIWSLKGEKKEENAENVKYLFDIDYNAYESSMIKDTTTIKLNGIYPTVSVDENYIFTASKSAFILWTIEGDSICALRNNNEKIYNLLFLPKTDQILISTADRCILCDLHCNILTKITPERYYVETSFSPDNEKIALVGSGSTLLIQLTSKGIIKWLEKRNLKDLTSAEYTEIGIDFLFNE